MKIRNKILIYFSCTVIALTAVTLLFVYLFFSAYREEEFQNRQKEKITTTLRFLTQIKQTDSKLIEAIDQLTINDLYDEKLLLFNHKKELIYSSVDDMPIQLSEKILTKLNNKTHWIETKEGLYDVVGMYIHNNNSIYYGISKAYDTHGYAKLSFLRNTLIILFSITSTITLFISLFLAKRISQPITQLSDILESYTLGNEKLPQEINSSTHEIVYLHKKFNELIHRANEAFTFQKHSIHHISHQLKTPLATIVSELERIKDQLNDPHLLQKVETQIQKTKSLADIINILLELSKIETRKEIKKQETRIDEIIFDNIEELNILYPHFQFEVNYQPDAEQNVNKLVINANTMLMKQALQNLLHNCIAYSNTPKANILINYSIEKQLVISISNSGIALLKKEEKYIFDYFFRGENSRGSTGFGLGLALVKKIISLHKGEITYTNPQKNINTFSISLPIT